jgi:hypothetical protein
MLKQDKQGLSVGKEDKGEEQFFISYQGHPLVAALLSA